MSGITDRRECFRSIGMRRERRLVDKTGIMLLRNGTDRRGTIKVEDVIGSTGNISSRISTESNGIAVTSILGCSFGKILISAESGAVMMIGSICSDISGAISNICFNVWSFATSDSLSALSFGMWTSSRDKLSVARQLP